MRILLCVALSALAGCATMNTVETTTDKFTGSTNTQMSFNPLAGATIGFDDSQVRLEASKNVAASGETTFLLVVSVAGNSQGWTFIEDGESLLFLVDGERVALSGDGSAGHRDVAGGNCFETAVYVTDAAFLHRLANAKEVEVRVSGSERNIDRKFSETNTKNFQEFVAAHVPTPSG